ncbi:hypothetical protein UWK_00030 [Desulfocapsa sulfexigens DSM 10523]|uniref:EF-hand domain-containing protein n=1 Tax=Desulfocapsa sulfexigens (strain DSM 10523 / SB164P1) TaxID=1167006 RepID=M1NZD9_DESSD|nr:hypothetical protein [Desulfocapsa sulfexigens]AGF76618.1 hypothetical protein UWK_00030 [Desulfocapsa sulfexigens DSM 10523]
MKINTSHISMDASAEHRDVTGRVAQMVAGRLGEDPEFRLNLSGEPDLRRERVEESRQSQECTAISTVHCTDGEKEYKTTADHALEQMVTEVVGQRVRLRRIQGLEGQGNVILSEPLNPPGKIAVFSFASVSTSYHYEKVSIHSSGSVQLEDGRDLNFSLDLSMERQARVTESMAWRGAGGVLMDPLVFNFDCNLENLANRSFQFDLDSDGISDESFSLQPGSGFLALDLNNDKKINNGSELFGPSTGYGFQELALHDMDRNGWIDENDEIFKKLRIWSPEKSGEAALLSLQEAGVGAICLTHDKTAFQLRDRDNVLMGEVAANGFFLTEDGEVRPVQEIKLAMKEKDENGTGTISEREFSEAQIFLRQMVTIRQEEVREIAKRRLRRRDQEERRDLLAVLFPDREKERGLASVIARVEGTTPA